MTNENNKHNSKDDQKLMQRLIKSTEWAGIQPKMNLYVILEDCFNHFGHAELWKNENMAIKY